MRRTMLIVMSVVALLAVVGVVSMKWRSGAVPDAIAETTAANSGRGLTLQFSDKPVAMPALALSDVSGRPIDKSSWAGKVVLVNFWATWCGPCREEIPALVALQERYKDRVVILGLSIDTRPAAEVAAFAQQYHINYPVAVVGDDVQQAFGGLPAVPSTFVVSPAGKMMQRHVGLLDPVRTEHEVRVLAGLPSEAVVQTVPDTGQVFLANAAYATEIPGVDLKTLSASQREKALTTMNTEHCSCGCGLTVAQCRINDPTCDVSLPQAQKIAQAAAK
ncbi:MAG: TlpA disulfide reductase family protein [Acidobacteriota bacterium]